MFTTTSAHTTTYGPSMDPTDEPSAHPTTYRPTYSPTVYPTDEPSADPTQIPTAPSLECVWSEVPEEAWFFDAIQGDDAITGKYASPRFVQDNLIVYVIDRAVNLEHEHFSHLADENKVSLDVYTPTLWVDHAQSLDHRNAHGTHVAGSIVGQFYGILRDDDITLKTCTACWDDAGCPLSIIDACLRIIIDDLREERSERGSRTRGVINLSIAGFGCNVAIDIFDALFRKVQNVGGVVVVSAGNDNANACAYVPACSSEVVTVGAYNEDYVKSWFSNYGECVDAWAPGDNILSSVGSDNDDADYATMSGTSMASPLMSGMIGQLLMINNSLDTDNIKAIVADAENGFEFPISQITVAAFSVGCDELDQVAGGYHSSEYSPETTSTLAPSCEWQDHFACTGSIIADLDIVSQHDCISACQMSEVFLGVKCLCATWLTDQTAKCRLETGDYATHRGDDAPYQAITLKEGATDRYPIYSHNSDIVVEPGKCPFSEADVSDCEWTSDAACTGSVISKSTVWHMMTRDDCVLQCKMHSNCNCATYIEGHVCRMQTGYSIESIYSTDSNYEALLMTDARDVCVSDNELNSDTLFRFNDGMWGGWLGADYCEEGKFARGFMIRSEWPVGGGDDTAANAVKLYCSSPGWSDSGNRNVCPSTSDLSCSKVGEFEGYWGDWCASGAQCPSGEFIVGFDQKVEGAIGNGDDTALNDIAALCSDGTIVKAACNTAEYGRWGHWSAGSEYRFAVCADGSRVCGLNQKVEAQQGGGDDTALNAVRMYCCDSDDAQSATAINVVHTVDQQPESGTIPRSVVTIDLGSWPMMALVLIVLVLLIANLWRMAKSRNTRTYAKVDIADSEDMSENEVEAINIE